VRRLDAAFSAPKLASTFLAGAVIPNPVALARGKRAQKVDRTVVRDLPSAFGVRSS